MKLNELQPRWIGVNNQGPVLGGYVRFGISFLCPHCRERRITVAFSKPIVPPEQTAFVIEKYGPEAAFSPPLTGLGNLWDRTGDSFDTLSLTPSVDCSACGHWHGFISNGECTP